MIDKREDVSRITHCLELPGCTLDVLKISKINEKFHDSRKRKNIYVSVKLHTFCSQCVYWGGESSLNREVSYFLMQHDTKCIVTKKILMKFKWCTK